MENKSINWSSGNILLKITSDGGRGKQVLFLWFGIFVGGFWGGGGGR